MGPRVPYLVLGAASHTEGHPTAKGERRPELESWHNYPQDFGTLAESVPPFPQWHPAGGMVLVSVWLPQVDGHTALPSWQLVAETSPLPGSGIKSSRN